MTGNEVIDYIVNQLACSNIKIVAKPEEIKTSALNKEGKWVDFDPAKIKFTYSK